MKLANKEFPFWAWFPKKRGMYVIIRFVEKRPPWDEYVYDYLLRVYSSDYSPATAYARKLRYPAKYAKATVSGFKEVSSLPRSGKKFLLDHIFNPEGN